MVMFVCFGLTEFADCAASKKHVQDRGNSGGAGSYLKIAKLVAIPSYSWTPFNLLDRALRMHERSRCTVTACRCGAGLAAQVPHTACSSAGSPKSWQRTRGDNPDEWVIAGCAPAFDHSGEAKRVSNSGAFRHQNSVSQILGK